MKATVFTQLGLASAIAVATFATGSSARAAVVATYQTEIYAPTTSLALGWTYSYTTAAFNETTYSNATVRISFDQNWNLANNEYNAYNDPLYTIVYGAANARVGEMLPPDGGVAIIARWTSDVIGTSVTLNGTFQKLFSQANVGNSEVWLSINGATPISLASVAPTNLALQNFSYAPVTPVAIALGDTIELITVGKQNNWNGDLRLNAAIDVIPEPTTFALLALGGVAFTGLRRRRQG